MTNLQGITSIECENHHKLNPYTYDRSDKCKQEQEQEHLMNTIKSLRLLNIAYIGKIQSFK